MALHYRRQKNPDSRSRRCGRSRGSVRSRAVPVSEVFDSGRKTIIDCAHVRVERLDTRPVLFSKVFKEFEDGQGRRYDYRYWAERENFFLREFLKKQSEFTHVVQARHLISENDAAKQVLTYDAGITIADWLRVKSRYADTATLSHPFQRSDMFLRLIRACLVALKEIHEHRIVHCDIKEDNICIPYSPNPYPAKDGDPSRVREAQADRLCILRRPRHPAHPDAGDRSRGASPLPVRTARRRAACGPQERLAQRGSAARLSSGSFQSGLSRGKDQHRGP
jgi:hypothetical protein